MNIPNYILQALDSLEPADRGMAYNNNASNSNGPTCSSTSPQATTPPLRRAGARRSIALQHVATSSNRPFDVLEHVAP